MLYLIVNYYYLWLGKKKVWHINQSISDDFPHYRTMFNKKNLSLLLIGLYFTTCNSQIIWPPLLRSRLWPCRWLFLRYTGEGQITFGSCVSFFFFFLIQSNSWVAHSNSWCIWSGSLEPRATWFEQQHLLELQDLVLDLLQCFSLFPTFNK